MNACLLTFWEGGKSQALNAVADNACNGEESWKKSVRWFGPVAACLRVVLLSRESQSP